MQFPTSFAIGPLGTWEMIIIAVLLLIVGVVVGGAILLAIYLAKKK